MKLIVGLGNPGDKFIGTRHNLGFEVLDELLRKLMLTGTWSEDANFKAEVCKNEDLILAKPQTFMNKSGLSVKALTNFYKLKPEDIIIVHDELDLPLGHIKIRMGGSDAGHHGIESIISELKDEQFIRVRLGIGNLKALSGEHKHRAFNAEHFVVDYFTPTERSKARSLVKKAVKAIEILLKEGLERTQNQYN